MGDEEALFTMRSELFRFDRDLKEWKERGTGNVRFMQHKTTKKIRLLMRRERTLKVCANHVVTDGMKLEPNASSDRSWVYTCPADFADEEDKAPEGETGDEDTDDLAAAFKAADKDGSGKLSAAEFKAVLESLSQYDTPEKVEAAMKKADTSGDGEISWKEFVAMAESHH